MLLGQVTMLMVAAATVDPPPRGWTVGDQNDWQGHAAICRAAVEAPDMQAEIEARARRLSYDSVKLDGLVRDCQLYAQGMTDAFDGTPEPDSAIRP